MCVVSITVIVLPNKENRRGWRIDLCGKPHINGAEEKNVFTNWNRKFSIWEIWLTGLRDTPVIHTLIKSIDKSVTISDIKHRTEVKQQ